MLDRIPDRRRWRLLALEIIFACILFTIAIFVAMPVFLTPLQDEPDPPMNFYSLLATHTKDTILGYAPDTAPYTEIMTRAGQLLQSSFTTGSTEQDLNSKFYSLHQGNLIRENVTWVIWKPKIEDEVYKFSIRSQELAWLRQEAPTTNPGEPVHLNKNPHLESGFLAVQLAVSQALLEHLATQKKKVLNVELSLKSMPISPLMEERRVRRIISLILMCFTIAFLPPVLDTQALVVTETAQRFKRALRIRSVDYMTIYLAWLWYALHTAVPICIIGSFTLIFIFRWIHVFHAFILLLFYFLLMTMLALIMAMAHSEALIAGVWTISQTLLQTFMAELMVHHNYNKGNPMLNFIIHMFMPPLGLLYGLNQFALLHTAGLETAKFMLLEYTILSWVMLIFVYFMFLMLLQRTVGAAAIGGQVSWKTIIFKRAEDPNALRTIPKPRPLDLDKLEKVDEFKAKAISFRNVSKSIMNVPILSNLTFDIYRGEYSILVSERTQDKAMNCVCDLLTGATYADSGSINVLGVDLCPERNIMTEPMMMGYCDQSSFLINDLTVEEHFTLYAEICLWKLPSKNVLEYIVVRSQILKKECDLEGLENKRVRELGSYYQAQLCWAIAVLIEPRIVVVPMFQDTHIYESVIKDKIVNYRKYVTIIQITLSSMNVITADRIFLIDNRVLAFGGSPAYMFLKYGREYRLRLTTKSFNNQYEEEDHLDPLLEVLKKAGATIRAHTGSLLILRIATTPTERIANLLKDIEENAETYAVLSINVSLPDPAEVFRRAIHETRVMEHVVPDDIRIHSEMALQQLEGFEWKRKNTWFNIHHLRMMGWKYFSFYIHYRFFFILTIMSCVLTGAAIGYDLGTMLKDLDPSRIINSQLMTVEAADAETILSIRLDSSPETYSVVQHYVTSTEGASTTKALKINYIALAAPQSITEYLVTKAIDSPQEYVHSHAYGLQIEDVNNNGHFKIKVLYSPVHSDKSAAARSLARVYMALMRYYSEVPTASLEITDDPLLTQNLDRGNRKEALLIQFLMVLTISHIALMPSKEHGLIRHVQKNALNFSPVKYWLSLSFCDLIHYWLLVLIMFIVIFSIFYFMCSIIHITFFTDLVIIPCMLMVHGLGCVPQAYLFSLGPRPTLNSMALIIVNLVFGEATIIAKFVYGKFYLHAMKFMYISPQFNLAVALIKIKNVFQRNSECRVFNDYNICGNTMLHRCCAKCGVLQACFTRDSYIKAVLPQIYGTIYGAMLFAGLLLLWEYKLIQLLYNYVHHKIWYVLPSSQNFAREGAVRERTEVLEKLNQLEKKRKLVAQNTFGEYVLAVNVSKLEHNQYFLRNVYLGVGKGEVLAVAGLKIHGRVHLCQILAGYMNHDEGEIYALSKYRTKFSPHKYASRVGLCVDMPMLPGWMTVEDALEMIALLRGVPKKHAVTEVSTYIDALNLTEQKYLLVCRLRPTERKRLNFAATVVGAPPILCLDECSAYQNYVVRRAMYNILKLLRRRGCAIIHCGFDMETHLPLTNRLAILRDGYIYDVDYVDTMLERYSKQGYIVVVQLNSSVDVPDIFKKYFQSYTVNDEKEMLFNMQVLDKLSWAEIFEKMEKLQQENEQVNSYIVCGKPIDYIYYEIISREKGCQREEEVIFKYWLQRYLFGERSERKIKPPTAKMRALQEFEKKYELTTLAVLPWSVIFDH